MIEHPALRPSKAERSAKVSPGAVGVLLLLLLLGLPTLFYPYGRDQGIFAYVGAVWRRGGLPYRDAWDVKLPAIYAVYAWVGGAEWGPRALDLVAAAATALALMALGRWVQTRRTSARSEANPPSAPIAWSSLGGVAAALYVFYTLAALDYWNLAQVETLIAPLSACAVLAALCGQPLVAGLLAGTAAAFKTTAVLLVIPVLVALRFDPANQAGRAGGSLSSAQTRVRWALALAGWVTPLLLFVAYFAGRGAVGYLAELVATQAEYAGGDPRLMHHSPLYVIQALGLRGYLPLVALSAVGLAAWLHRGTEDAALRWTIAAWWLFTLAQVVGQRRFYLYHWTVFTPAAAWLAAYALFAIAGWARAAGRWRAVVLASTAVLGLVAIDLALQPRWERWGALSRVFSGRLTVRDFKRGFYGVFDYSVAEGMDAADHIRVRSRPGDGLFVMSFEPEVYLYSGRFAPTRHASNAPIVGETSIREARRRRWFQELMLDLYRHPPLYLVERENDPAALPEWVAPFQQFRVRGYAFEGRFGSLRVYRRLGSRYARRPRLDTSAGRG